MNSAFIDNCILNAYNLKSNLDNRAINIPGMCGTMTRHLYNNINSLPKVKYLEIGCWKGASSIASLYKNDHIKATIIDNWSEFSNARFDFSKNISKYINSNLQLQLLNENCFKLHSKLLYSPYNVFVYDGPHDSESQKLAIVRFWEYLDKSCIIIIDDWCWDDVKRGTIQGLEQVGANIVYHKEIVEPLGSDGFWNGCGIFLIEK